MTSGLAPQTRACDASPALRQRRRVPQLALNAAAVALGIAAWAGITASGIVGLPGPWEVLRQAIAAARSGQLAADMLASLARVLTGFALGVLLAVPVGFLMGWYRLARGLIEPYVQFFRMIPPLAVIPLAIVTMGTAELPKVFVIFLAAILSSVVAVYGGVISVDKTLIDAARVLGAGDGTIFRRVVVPASLPFIMVGLRIGLGSSWATVVAAALIAAQSGLGFRMQQTQLYYDLPSIFVSLIARQNVEFGLRIARMPRARRRQVADYFMDLVGLRDFADALPKTLSGGMKQRCAIARLGVGGGRKEWTSLSARTSSS